MKGIIFNIIEELVRAKLSSGAWDDERAGRFLGDENRRQRNRK